MTAGASTKNDFLAAIQPRASRTINRLIDEGRTHAFLLSGAMGSGPRAYGSQIARRILCPNGGFDDCETCGRVDRRVHPDLIWVTPEGNDLTKQQIDLIVETTTLMPFEGIAQVVVLEQADSLSFDNRSAGNTLLKSLEEPEGRVVFVLLAERAARILPTIRSRCVEVVFPAIPNEQLITALQINGVDEHSIEVATGMSLRGICRAANGDLERALEIAFGKEAAQRRSEVLTGMYQVATARMVPSQFTIRIISRAKKAGDFAAEQANREFDEMELVMSDRQKKAFNAKTNNEGREKRAARRSRKARVAELESCLFELSSWWRDVLCLSAGSPDDVVANIDRLEQTQHVANGPASSMASVALATIDDASSRLHFNNADETITVGALIAELAALSQGRMHTHRIFSGGARTPQGYELTFG